MASSGKKKTTMAKLNRESRVRERRLEKQAKKDARKRASADHSGEPNGALTGVAPPPHPLSESASTLVGERATEVADDQTSLSEAGAGSEDEARNPAG